MPNKNSQKASTDILPVSLQRHLNMKSFLIHYVHSSEADIFLCFVCRNHGLDEVFYLYTVKVGL